MNVVLTGASGFLGERLLARLAQDGAHGGLVVLGRSRPAHLPEGASFVAADLRGWDAPEVDAALREADVVYHLAAMSSPAEAAASPFEALEVNAVATLRLLERMGPRARMVLASTCRVHERPLSPYGAGKLASELFLTAASGRGAPGHVALRLHNVFGAGQRPSFLVPTLLHALHEQGRARLRNGGAVADFLYVDDAVDAFLAAARAPRDVGGVLDVGSGAPTRVDDLARRFCARWGEGASVEFERIAAQPEMPPAELKRTEDAIGWRPRTSLDEGIARTVDEFRARMRQA